MTAATLDREFQQRGYIGPLTMARPELAIAVGGEFAQEFDPVTGAAELDPMTSAHRFRNHHLRRESVATMVGDPAIVAAVQAVYGQDLVLWRTNLFVQTGRPKSRNWSTLGWHFDQYDLLLEPPDSISVQVGLTAGAPDNCLLVLPGSHLVAQDDLEERYGLRSDQALRPRYGTPYYEAPPDLAGVDRLNLAPGEFIVFHRRLLHASSVAGPDSPTRVRLALAMRLSPPRVKILPRTFEETAGDGCVLLAGDDQYGLNDYVPWNLQAPANQ